MRIEPARLADLDRVVDLWVALAAEQRDHGAHLTAEPNRSVLRETLAQRVVDHTCLVARDDHAASAGKSPAEEPPIVGFVAFALERDGLDRDVDRGVVENLYVVPECRGQGIGGELVTAAEDALTAAGADRVALEVMAANDAARRFYERQGYGPHRVTYERPTGDGKDTKEGG
ncbi:MAG: N-acetyltransferase family protein [Halobacteriales archaeon]